MTLVRGRHTAVVGPSGAGKSLFLHALFGWLKDGPDAVLSPRDGGYLMIQDPGGGLTPALSVAGHFRELGLGRDWRARVTAVMARLDLDAVLLSRLPEQLSGGQRQRVMLALILCRRPRWVVCDEPAASLDRDAERAMVALLKAEADHFGFTLVFVTHQGRLVREMADQVLMIDRGKAAFFGGVAAFFEAPARGVHADLVAAWQARDAVSPPPVSSDEPRLLHGRVALGYGDVWLVRDWPLHLTPGRLHWLAAPSGAGKTTLAKLLAGFPEPARWAGELALAEKPLAADWRLRSVEHRYAVAWLFQHGHAAFNPHTPMAQQWKRLIAGCADRQARPLAELAQAFERWREILGLGSLDFARSPATFSIGERQRCQLLRALLLQPRLLIADELLSALDVLTRRVLLDLLRRFAEERQAAVLLFSHNPDWDTTRDRRLLWPAG
nr:ATP-binding cassette domain-containing protein [Acanthopleuribacter pedis]